MLAAGLVGLAVAGCGGPQEPTLGERWYTQSQLDQGRSVFLQNCAVCHGVEATGTADWKRRLADGSLPPPPLNGTAHAWHHDLATLDRSIRDGGVPLGGTMPAFGERLDAEARQAAIAYFQSFWSDEIYQRWVGMFGDPR